LDECRRADENDSDGERDPRDLLVKNKEWNKVPKVKRLAAPTEQANAWERHEYDEWVKRLGAKRMDGVLCRLLDQFRTLTASLGDADGKPSEDVHRRSHDVASTAGMLGFGEVTRRCRAVLEAASFGEELRARVELAHALRRAILRLDRHLSAVGRAVAA
jgi:hypothetical protein